MKDRFDLEDAIMKTWCITEDVDLLLENVIDSPRFSNIPAESCDKIANALLGIKELYELRFEKLYDTFKEVHKLDKYNG